MSARLFIFLFLFNPFFLLIECNYSHDIIISIYGSLGGFDKHNLTVTRTNLIASVVYTFVNVQYMFYQCRPAGGDGPHLVLCAREEFVDNLSQQDKVFQ